MNPFNKAIIRNIEDSTNIIRQEKFETLCIALGFVGVLIICLVLWSQT